MKKLFISAPMKGRTEAQIPSNHGADAPYC